MSPDRAFSAEEQLSALTMIAEELQDGEIGVLALGSAAVTLKTGQRATTTKDLDLHVFPVEDVVALAEELEKAMGRLGGRMRWEPDGATITAHVPIAGQEIPVEFVFGREDFIQPEVLEDAVKTAGERDDVLVPSWEHIVAMKAEAWFDRVRGERGGRNPRRRRGPPTRRASSRAEAQRDDADDRSRLRRADGVEQGMERGASAPVC